VWGAIERWWGFRWVCGTEKDWSSPPWEQGDGLVEAADAPEIVVVEALLPGTKKTRSSHPWREDDDLLGPGQTSRSGRSPVKYDV